MGIYTYCIYLCGKGSDVIHFSKHEAMFLDTDCQCQAVGTQ